MVDFGCRRFQPKITAVIDSFNRKLSAENIQISQTSTSDELQLMDRKSAELKVNPLLDLIIQNLASYYIKFSEQMYDIPSSEHGWEKEKLCEMITSTGLYYLTIQYDGATVGFISFLLTSESITGEEGKRVLYLMEIHLSKESSGHGLGRHLIEDYIFVLCCLLKMDLEFVCFKENNIGNRFYSKMGINMLGEKQHPQLSFWFEFLNVYRMENSDIVKRV